MKNKTVGDMTKSELIDFIIELQKNLGRTERKLKRKEILLDKIYEKCEINEGIHDYDVWVKLRYVWDELDNFAKDELGYFHRALTENYKANVKKASSFQNEMLHIGLKDIGAYDIILPEFKKGTMYKGMELFKAYTLQDLGLFKEGTNERRN